MAYAYALDPAVPANTALVRDGALAIREFKSAVIERLETFFNDIDNDPLQVKAGVVFLGDFTQNSGTATLATAAITTANVTTLNTDGAVTLTRASNVPLTVNRTTTTGTIIDVQYAGSSLVTFTDSGVVSTKQIQVSASQVGFRALATTVDMQMRANSSSSRGELGTLSNHGWVILVNSSIVATISSTNTAYGGGHNISGVGTITMNGAVSGATTGGFSDSVTVTSNTASKQFFVSSGTITGTGYPLFGTLSASVAVVGHIGNTGAGSAYTNIQVANGSGGDAYTAWVVNGVTTWSMGIDNSDSDNLKIGPNANPSTGTAAITISTAGNVTFQSGATIDFSGATITGLSGLTAANIAAGTYPVGDFLYQGNLTITKTSEQLRVRYDVSNYLAVTVSNGGGTDINAVAGGTAVITLSSAGTNMLTLSPTTITVNTAIALSTAASSAARAGFRIPAGTNPSSPVAGELWFDGTNLLFRDASTTRTINWT